MNWQSDIGIQSLLGKTLKNIVEDSYNDILTFECEDGTSYRMFHSQNCCESVSIEDINGDLDDLIGSPITIAYESNSNNEDHYGREEWTFYHLATVKGSVVIRWHGTSNGYYSVSVQFSKVN